MMKIKCLVQYFTDISSNDHFVLIFRYFNFTHLPGIVLSDRSEVVDRSFYLLSIHRLQQINSYNKAL